VKGKVKLMRNALRWYFWLEMGLAIVTGILFIVTLVQRQWIEILFNIDPDSGSGALEWLIVAVLLVVTVALFTLARLEWRRARAAIS
jgi:tetrahydromethanopterin S-methyltransferase subunit E